MLNWLKNLLKGSSDVSSGTHTTHYRSSSLTQRRHEAQTIETPKSLRQNQLRHSPPPPPPKRTAVWVPPGKSITVGEYVIPGGMIYVGPQLRTPESYRGTDPCLINPELPVDQANPDYEGSMMGYWPAYRDISPACRAAYLEWLSNGRKAPDAYIGYVFLFFYGLERRVFRDFPNLKIDTSSELTAIFFEVERLLNLYGSNSSFNGYASNFLDACQLLQPHQNFYEAEPPLDGQGYGVPINVQVALGQLVASKQPIPVQWLYAWYIHTDRARLRTPANRCRELFIELL
ncbi:MAG: TerB N-terminal domain-containing protein, partial [Cyanobacteria bacterium J06607_17]